MPFCSICAHCMGLIANLKQLKNLYDREKLLYKASVCTIEWSWIETNELAASLYTKICRSVIKE